MRMEDLNWMEVEGYLQREDRLILVLGACEQHGYLSLLTDAKIHRLWRMLLHSAPACWSLRRSTSAFRPIS